MFFVLTWHVEIREHSDVSVLQGRISCVDVFLLTLLIYLANIVITTATILICTPSSSKQKTVGLLFGLKPDINSNKLKVLI